MKKSLMISAVSIALLLAMSFVSLQSQAQQQQARHGGGGWEYKTLVRDRQLSMVNIMAGWRWSDWATTEDDVELSPTADNSLTYHFNRLGSEGWELATASPMEVQTNGGTTYNRMYYVFKRPKR